MSPGLAHRIRPGNPGNALIFQSETNANVSSSTLARRFVLQSLLLHSVEAGGSSCIPTPIHQKLRSTANKLQQCEEASAWKER